MAMVPFITKARLLILHWKPWTDAMLKWAVIMIILEGKRILTIIIFQKKYSKTESFFLKACGNLASILSALNGGISVFKRTGVTKPLILPFLVIDLVFH